MKLSPQTTLLISCLAGAGLSLVARTSLADLTATLPASQDVTLFGGSDATSNKTSSGPGMFVGSDGSSPKRAMIEFNISASIPPGAHITGATLNLTLGMWAGSSGTGMNGDQTPRTIRLFDATTAWNPSLQGTPAGTGTPIPTSGFGGTGHGYAPDTGAATWNYAVYNTTPWATTGGGGDFVSTESADTVVSQNLNTVYSWTSTQMVTDVQNWLDGTTANDGWLLKNDTESNTQSFRAFYTREGAAEQNLPNFAPNLVVTYTLTPEPATLLLMALAAPSLLIRRRPRNAP